MTYRTKSLFYAALAVACSAACFLIDAPITAVVCAVCCGWFLKCAHG